MSLLSTYTYVIYINFNFSTLAHWHISTLVPFAAEAKAGIAALRATKVEFLPAQISKSMIKALSRAIVGPTDDPSAGKFNIESIEIPVFIECCVCLSEYEIEGDLRPVCFPCGHGTCRGCFLQLHHKRCPTCKYVLQQEAPINFALIESLEKRIQAKKISADEMFASVVVDLTKKREKLQSKVESLDEELSRKAAEHSKLDREYKKLVSDLKTATDHHSDCDLRSRQEIDRLNRLINDFEREKIKLRDEIQSLRASHDYQQKLLSDKNCEIAKLTTATPNCSSCKKSAELTNNYRALYAESERQYSILGNKHFRLEQEVAEKEKVNRGRLERLEVYKKQIEDLQSGAEYDKIREDMKKTAESIAFELQTLRHDQSRLRSHNIAIAKRLQELGEDPAAMNYPVSGFDSYPLAIFDPETDYHSADDKSRVEILSREYNNALRTIATMKADHNALIVAFDILQQGEKSQWYSEAGINGRISDLQKAYSDFFDGEIAHKLGGCIKCGAGSEERVLSNHTIYTDPAKETRPPRVYSVTLRQRSKTIANLFRGNDCAIYDQFDTLYETYDLEDAKRFMKSKVPEYGSCKGMNSDWRPISLSIVMVQIGREISEGKMNEYFGPDGVHLPMINFG